MSATATVKLGLKSLILCGTSGSYSAEAYTIHRQT